MANMKLISLFDAAIKAEGAERQNDHEVILQVVEDELVKLTEMIEQLTERVDKLEARRPTFSG
jgi:arginine deiminase